jgi:hypothetical protein
MSTEAVMAHMEATEDPQVCGIEECGKPAIYHVVKVKDDDSEEERFFREEHGLEYATRGHLVISKSA